jgi:hypothetical protein
VPVRDGEALGIPLETVGVRGAGAVEVADDDDLQELRPKLRELSSDSTRTLSHVVLLAAVTVPVDSEEHLGADDAVSVDDGLDAELGRGRGEDGAD